MVRGFQGEDGLAADGVAMTTKHFPGGGARENGFDPHYAEGKFNVYPTPASLAATSAPLPGGDRCGHLECDAVLRDPVDGKSAMPQAPLTEFEDVGFAFNKGMLDLLRAMGHRGYINSDSGICPRWPGGWRSSASRAGRQGRDRQHRHHRRHQRRRLAPDRVPAGAVHHRPSRRRRPPADRGDVLLSGCSTTPTSTPTRPIGVVANAEFTEAAEDAHRRSVVLLKNHAATLPLTPDRLAGRSVYVESFEADLRVATLDRLRADLAAAHPDIRFTTDYHHADVAVLFVNPSTGDYFHATGLMDLDIHEATNINLAKITAIRAVVDHVVVGLNVKQPWLLGNLEPLADALLAGFDTRTETAFDAVVGTFAPTGRLPLTFPIDNAAIAVDEHGILRLTQRCPRLRQGTVHERTPLRLHRRRRQPLPARPRGLVLDILRLWTLPTGSGLFQTVRVTAAVSSLLRVVGAHPSRHDELGQRAGVQPTPEPVPGRHGERSTHVVHDAEAPGDALGSRDGGHPDRTEVRGMVGEPGRRHGGEARAHSAASGRISSRRGRGVDGEQLQPEAGTAPPKSASTGT